MKKLPFKVSPKPEEFLIGDETIGVLAIPKYGSLLVGEEIEIEQLGKRDSDKMKKAVSVAKKIADKKGISIQEAIELLDDGAITAGDIDLADIAEEIDSLIEMSGNATMDVSELATIILRSRVDPEWTTEDTGTLSRSFVNAVITFIQNERTGWAKQDSDKAGIEGKSTTKN